MVDKRGNYIGGKVIKKENLKVQITFPLEMEVSQAIHNYENAENPKKQVEVPEIVIVIPEGHDNGNLQKIIEVAIRQILLDNGFNTQGLECGEWLNLRFSTRFVKHDIF